MRNKTSLVLMEQLVMVLVFALVAALCLRAFVQARNISEGIYHQDEAVVIAQNAAQALKATADPEKAVSLVESAPYTLQITEKISGIPGLGMAEILVFHEGEAIISLTTGWQEVAS